MDEDFAMSPRIALHYVSPEVDREHIAEGNFIEPDAVGLHQEQVLAGRVPDGQMPPGHVALTLMFQNLTGLDQGACCLFG
jgi:hypothetical protein